ncbi:MAG TPA: hypothetical protein PLZ57_09060 [Pseudobdellovibrionaceae bacterium]|nr:hypothetical protein [Pseudobdellovibrionaceae bacterium]
MSKSSTDPRQPWLMWIERVLKDPKASSRLACLCAVLIVAYAYLLAQAGQESFGYPAGRDAREVQRERQREKRLLTYAESLQLPPPGSDFKLPSNSKWDIEAWLGQVLDASDSQADPLARASVAEALRMTFESTDADLRFIVRERSQISFWDQLKTWEEICRDPSWSIGALCEYAELKKLVWRREVSLWSLREILALRLVSEVVDRSPTEKLRVARQWVARLQSPAVMPVNAKDQAEESSELSAAGTMPWGSTWSDHEIREANLRLEWKLGLGKTPLASWAQQRRSEIQKQRRTWRVVDLHLDRRVEEPNEGIGRVDSPIDSLDVEAELSVGRICGAVTASQLARLKSRYMVWIHGSDASSCGKLASSRIASEQIILPKPRARWAWSPEEEMRHQVKELTRLNPRLKLTVLNLEALRLAMNQGLLSSAQRRQLDVRAFTMAELQGLHPLLRPQSVMEMSHGLLAVKSPLPLVVVMSQLSAI